MFTMVYWRGALNTGFTINTCVVTGKQFLVKACVQGSGTVQSLFVEAMVYEATSDKDVQAWQKILRSVFNTLKQNTFTDTAALQSKLFALDVFLRSPTVQKLLVRLCRRLHC